MSPQVAATLAGFARLAAAARHTPRQGGRFAWCDHCKAVTFHPRKKACSCCTPTVLKPNE